MILTMERVGAIYLGYQQPSFFLCVGYFWSTIFKICVEVLKHCHPCHIYTRNMRTHPTPLNPMIMVGPFSKWGVVFHGLQRNSYYGAQVYHYRYLLLHEVGRGNAYLLK